MARSLLRARCHRRYLALILAGLRGAEPLPGRSASWAEGERQWMQTDDGSPRGGGRGIEEEVADGVR